MRLQELLDKQDRTGKLSAKERREAAALTQLVDLLALIRLRATLARKQQASGANMCQRHWRGWYASAPGAGASIVGFRNPLKKLPSTSTMCGLVPQAGPPPKPIWPWLA
jgi:hypothetical protein